MKNNKGFSLVELIIVIAIMAILVGVLAPNLIKQLEKAKVSSDLELCDSVVTALTTAETDLATVQGIKSTDFPLKPAGDSIVLGTDSLTDNTKCTFARYFYEALGTTTGAAVNDSLKSSGADSVTVWMTADQQYKAWVDGTDSTGSKGKGSPAKNTISVN